MRTALLIAIPRKGPFQVLAGPDVTIDKQIAQFKKLAADRENAKLTKLQLWVSDAGVTKEIKFRDPKVEAKSQESAAAAARAQADRETADAEAKAKQLADEQAAQDAAGKLRLDTDEKTRLARAAEAAKQKSKK